jgi:hypothetical protein
MDSISDEHLDKFMSDTCYSNGSGLLAAMERAGRLHPGPVRSNEADSAGSHRGYQSW